MNKEKKYKTISAHIPIELERMLDKKAQKEKRSMSYTVGEILEAYMKSQSDKEIKKASKEN